MQGVNREFNLRSTSFFNEEMGKLAVSTKEVR